jgi:hypothetical protein
VCWDALRSLASAPQIQYLMELVGNSTGDKMVEMGSRLIKILRHLKSHLEDDAMLWGLVSIFPRYNIDPAEWSARNGVAVGSKFKRHRNYLVSWDNVFYIDWRVPLPHDVECPNCVSYANLSKGRDWCVIIPRDNTTMDDIHVCAICGTAWVVKRRHLNASLATPAKDVGGKSDGVRLDKVPLCANLIRNLVDGRHFYSAAILQDRKVLTVEEARGEDLDYVKLVSGTQLMLDFYDRNLQGLGACNEVLMPFVSSKILVRRLNRSGWFAEQYWLVVSIKSSHRGFKRALDNLSTSICEALFSYRPSTPSS